MLNIDGKTILVTGGTGSLGQTLVRRLLSGVLGTPKQVRVFSRDEAKQHYMRLAFLNRRAATDDIIYENAQSTLRFRIGDVRNESSLREAVKGCDLIFHGAALKQVPSCEYHPGEAVSTNVLGAENLARAVLDLGDSRVNVIGISTDKACKPVNVMGMTKALQERILLEANLRTETARFNCVRYGNVIASRGSIVPLFAEQIKRGDRVTVTLPEMTRFLLTLERAVDTVLFAAASDSRGSTFIPKVPSALIVDVAHAMMDGKEIPIEFLGIRPGEKIHEIMVSEEECFRTADVGEYFEILSILPELRSKAPCSVLQEEYSSRTGNVGIPEIKRLLHSAHSEIEAFTGAGS